MIVIIITHFCVPVYLSQNRELSSIIGYLLIIIEKATGEISGTQISMAELETQGSNRLRGKLKSRIIVNGK